MSNTIGDRIKAAREAKGISQEELGKVCGTTKQTIYKYETGIITNIPLDKLDKIASTLDVSSVYLMGWDSTPEYKALTEIARGMYKRETAPTGSADERDLEMMSLLTRLTPEQKEMLLLQIKGLLRGQE